MDERGLVAESFGETKHLEKSPFVQGFLAAVKGALLAAPAGAAVAALKGKNPILGALIGGLGVGALSGIAKATTQKVDNISAEEAMRYHIAQMKSREPMIFMPPPSVFGKIFTHYHGREHGMM